VLRGSRIRGRSPGDRTGPKGEDRDGHDEGTERTRAEGPERTGHVGHLRFAATREQGGRCPGDGLDVRAVPPQPRLVMHTVNATAVWPAMTWNS